MGHSDLTICLMTDEVSPSLDEGLAFAREESIGRGLQPKLTSACLPVLSAGI